jgi:hypothetical protein
MEDCTWTFARGDQRLGIFRRASEEVPELVILGDEAPRIARFKDLASLAVFQSDMEIFLLRTGWALMSFSPDQRSSGDRRFFPRIAADRRRWWTDGKFPGRAEPLPR